MVDKTDDKTEIDPDTLSDEEFMKLEVPTEEAVEETKTEEKDDESNASEGASDSATDAGDQDGAGGSSEESSGSGGGEGEETLTDEEKAAAEVQTDEDKAAAKIAQEAEEAEAEDGSAKETSANADKETLTLKDKEEQEKKAKAEATTKSEIESQELAQAQENSNDFFKKVSAPFKADGKEVQVRTPEEAIRLMQMGVNYSRRMKEMKPLREMDAMLTAHGLNDPQKLNELIDLSKGSKEAIQKYLKKHNIDPLDLDLEKADSHTTPNYRSDPKDVAFQEAIDITLQTEGGKELLGDVNRDWDDESKETLRENPSLFGKLLEQKDIGVYEQINKELLHQRTMGYLANVPFLQAYEQVGNAMQKAGVFDKAEQKTGLAPIASGSRKAAPKKTEQPNPNLSSANTNRKAAEAALTEPDYLSMSDEDFMKLAQPV